MRFCTYDENGVILSIGFAHDDDPPEAFAHLGARVVKWISDAVTPSTHYVDVSVSSTDVRTIPQRPGKWYAWDHATHAWQPMLANAVSSRCADVDAERQRRNVLPITVGAITLDADLVAQRNLSDKMTEVSERIRLGIAMPAGLLIWKDFYNAVHTFQDIQTYFDWMSSYTVALAERGTRLYIAGWNHKDTLATLTSVEAVEAYDINAGWPA